MKRPVLLLSMLAAMLLLLAACSSAEEAGQTATEATDTVTEEASEPMVEETSEPMAEETSEPAAAADTETRTLSDIAATNPSFGTLAQALDAAGLTSALEEAGPFTLFAPNDQAFAQLDQAELNQLLANTQELGDVLQYHVVEGQVTSADLEDGQTLTTLQGGELTVSIDGSTVMINDATVVQPDIQAANGVVHVIDRVLIP